MKNLESTLELLNNKINHLYENVASLEQDLFLLLIPAKEIEETERIHDKSNCVAINALLEMDHKVEEINSTISTLKSRLQIKNTEIY